MLNVAAKKRNAQKALLSEETRIELESFQKQRHQENYSQLCEVMNARLIAEVGAENCSMLLLSGK